MAGCLSRKKVVPICSGRRYNEGRNRSVSDSCRYANGVSVGYGVRGSLADISTGQVTSCVFYSVRTSVIHHSRKLAYGSNNPLDGGNQCKPPYESLAIVT